MLWQAGNKSLVNGSNTGKFCLKRVICLGFISDATDNITPADSNIINAVGIETIVIAKENNKGIYS